MKQPTTPLIALTLSLLVMILAVVSHAQATTPLDGTMKQMGEKIKPLIETLFKGKPATDESLVKSAQELVALAKVADQQLPAKATTPTEIAEFHSLIRDLVAALTELEQSLEAGNRTSAADIMQNKVAPVQKRGHDLFKPPHS